LINQDFKSKNFIFFSTLF